MECEEKQRLSQMSRDVESLQAKLIWFEHFPCDYFVNAIFGMRSRLKDSSGEFTNLRGRFPKTASELIKVAIQ